MENHALKLTLVTNKSNRSTQEYLRFITICAQSGLTAVQLREKNLSTADLITFGKQLQNILEPLGIPLIVNDDLKLCIQLNAAGLHLGQTDGDVITAREILGPAKIIGLSVNTLTELIIANTLPIDYVGIGAIFPTKNKPNVQTIWGLSALKQAAKISKHPIVAIGGIDENNASLVMEAGASGIAAIGLFHDTNTPEITTRNLRDIIDRSCTTCSSKLQLHSKL